MTTVKISGYDPAWQDKWESQYELAKDLWRRALGEIREFGAVRPETSRAWRDSIMGRRQARKHQYRDTGDVARRLFNILAGRAALAGQKFEARVNPEDFNSIREIREFFSQQMQAIQNTRAAREKRRRSLSPMPVLPKGESLLFNGVAGAGHSVMTQAFYVPDVENGIVIVLMTQRVDDETYICVSARSAPGRLRQVLPELATRIHQRLFPEEDPNTLHFMVHHPLGHGDNHNEQYWRYDLRPDARGAFHLAARHPLQVLPYGVANKEFSDGKPEAETCIIEMDNMLPYRPGVELMVQKQEQYTQRREKILGRRASRKGVRQSKATNLSLH